jgi:hypothetical protein
MVELLRRWDLIYTYKRPAARPPRSEPIITTSNFSGIKSISKLNEIQKVNNVIF